MKTEECIRILYLDGRVNWNWKNREGKTPLDLAIEFDNVVIIGLLLQNPSVKKTTVFMSILKTATP